MYGRWGTINRSIETSRLNQLTLLVAHTLITNVVYHQQPHQSSPVAAAVAAVAMTITDYIQPPRMYGQTRATMKNDWHSSIAMWLGRVVWMVFINTAIGRRRPPLLWYVRFRFLFGACISMDAKIEPNRTEHYFRDTTKQMKRRFWMGYHFGSIFHSSKTLYSTTYLPFDTQRRSKIDSRTIEWNFESELIKVLVAFLIIVFFFFCALLFIKFLTISKAECMDGIYMKMEKCFFLCHFRNLAWQWQGRSRRRRRRRTENKSHKSISAFNGIVLNRKWSHGLNGSLNAPRGCSQY